MKYINTVSTYGKTTNIFAVEDHENYEQQCQIAQERVNNSAFGGYIRRIVPNIIEITYYND